MHTMSHLTRAAALSVALLLGATACGSDDPEPAAATTTAPATPATEPVTTDAPDPTTPATEPADTTAATEPAADEVPSKIVSLYPTATEMIYAIGAGDQVIAVDDQSNFPEEALEKQTDLSGFEPNVEAIAGYEPDLVLIDGTAAGLQEQLEELGLTVWVGPAAQDFDDIYVQIEQLGAATGHIGEAAELVAQMQADIEAAMSSVPSLDQPPSYYHELDPTFYSVTSNTFIGDVYGLFGLVNIADTVEGDSDYPQLSAEFIISQSPDLIFLADTKCCGETAASVGARDGWDAISAVSTGNVISIDDDIASRWGPRVVDYIEIVAEAVNEVALLSAG
jgi:iron complex transport system substrate-binding protein